MIKFSFKTKVFYDPSLSYPVLPNDLVEVSNEQHLKLLDAINRGCIIFEDLTYSVPKPSLFHTWNGSKWIDPRTQQEIDLYHRQQIPALTKRQFALALEDQKVDANTTLYDQVMKLIASDKRIKIEYETISKIERLHPSTVTMIRTLGLAEVKVDEIWKYALTL